MIDRRRIGAAVVLVLGALTAAVLVYVRPWEPPGSETGSTARTVSTSGSGSSALDSADWFLDHYEEPGGRVVRSDQGGDTVSEGEAYAMLLAVATGRQDRFDAAWSWSRSHLLMPDGLLAWRYEDGRVADPSSAADADLDTAWALSLAATRFSDGDYRRAAQRLAAGIVAHDEETVAGRPVLLPGPWAAAPAPTIDPSYFAPLDMETLGSLDPGGNWAALAASSRALLSELLGANHLPSDWAIVVPDGTAHPTAPPGQSGAAVVYGFDAVRVPVRLAASCSPSDVALAASMWPDLQTRAQSDEDLVNLDLGGGSMPSSSGSPVGLVGAAAAAAAAGQRDEAALLLDRAQFFNASSPTYYGSAWVALGRVLLETNALGGCPPLRNQAVPAGSALPGGGSGSGQ